MTMSAALDATRDLDWGREDERSRRLAGLLGFFGGDDVIDMLERRHGYFPKVFSWRGRRYDVYAVERCWTIARRSLRGQVERYFFRVRARPRTGGIEGEETFEIYQDLQDSSWHMHRRAT
jgi:hypothetical protein